MAARYQDNRAVGQSLYNADFDGDKVNIEMAIITCILILLLQSYGEWSSRLIKDGKKVGRRQKTTLFQKRTHFELGSDPPNLESVTGSSFAAHETLGKPSSVSVDGNGKSNVFRAEDTVSSREEERDRFVSVQKRDFLTSTSRTGVIFVPNLSQPLVHTSNAVVQNSLQFQDTNEANSEGEFTGRNYQTSTHFHFGDSLEPSSSVYNQGEVHACS